MPLLFCEPLKGSYFKITLLPTALTELVIPLHQGLVTPRLQVLSGAVVFVFRWLHTRTAKNKLQAFF